MQESVLVRWGGVRCGDGDTCAVLGMFAFDQAARAPLKAVVETIQSTMDKERVCSEASAWVESMPFAS